MPAYTPTEALAAAIEYLRAEYEEAGGPVAVGIGTIVDELGDKRPNTADDLLDLIHGLYDDPRIDHDVPDDDTLSFAWRGDQ